MNAHNLLIKLQAFLGKMNDKVVRDVWSSSTKSQVAGV